MLNKELLLMRKKGSNTLLVRINVAGEGVLTVSAISPIGEELGVITADEGTKDIRLPLDTDIYFRAPTSAELELDSWTGIIIIEGEQTVPNQVPMVIVGISGDNPTINYTLYA